jgi:hypothetical protein
LKGSNKTVDHCPTCGANAAGARFCNMCGARLLADVLVDTAAGQASRSRPDFYATAPVASLPEQFEALFRPISDERPIDATQPMTALRADDGGLPIAPPAADPGDGGGRRRVLAVLAVLGTLVALVIVVAVLVTGSSGTAASGTQNVATTRAVASSTAPPAAVNNPAAGTTTAPSKATTTKASETGKATTTTKATTEKWAGDLGVGSHGTRVKQVQQALRDLHLYFGRVSGEYDTSTAAAVLLFQSAHHITGDPFGTVGQATWDALMKAAG